MTKEEWKKYLGAYDKLYLNEAVLKEKIAAKEKYGQEIVLPIVKELELCCKDFDNYINGSVNEPIDGMRDIDISQSLANNEIEKLICRIDEKNYQNPIVGKAYGKLLELKNIISVKDGDYVKASAEIKDCIPIIRECAFAVAREDYLNTIMEDFIVKAKNALQAVTYLDIAEAGKLNDLTQNTLDFFNFEVDSDFHVNTPTKDNFSGRRNTKTIKDKENGMRGSIRDKLLKNLERAKKSPLEKKEPGHNREEAR